MNILFGNYGNQTIAVMQWAYQNNLRDIYIVSIDTGWAAESWIDRVNAAEDFAKKCGFTVVRLQANPTFQNLIEDRQDFPSNKFQWCSGFLKGLTLLNWLDQYDAGCQASIILGKRRADSRANFDLPEIIPESEHYNNRKIWHPLYNCDNVEFQRLIKAAGFELLNHRSLECDPCINNSSSDFVRMGTKKHINAMIKVNVLEQSLNKTMFEFPIGNMVKQAKASQQANSMLESFAMGCGSPFACGE